MPRLHMVTHFHTIFCSASPPCSLLLPGWCYDDRRHNDRGGLRQREPAGKEALRWHTLRAMPAPMLARREGLPAAAVLLSFLVLPAKLAQCSFFCLSMCCLVHCDALLQGDVRFAEVMGLMGAKVEWAPYSITITGKSRPCAPFACLASPCCCPAGAYAQTYTLAELSC